jgi:hypothetical protein
VREGLSKGQEGRELAIMCAPSQLMTNFQRSLLNIDSVYFKVIHFIQVSEGSDEGMRHGPDARNPEDLRGLDVRCSSESSQKSIGTGS